MPQIITDIINNQYFASFVVTLFSLPIVLILQDKLSKRKIIELERKIVYDKMLYMTTFDEYNEHVFINIINGACIEKGIKESKVREITSFRSLLLLELIHNVSLSKDVKSEFKDQIINASLNEKQTENIIKEINDISKHFTNENSDESVKKKRMYLLLTILYTYIAILILFMILYKDNSQFFLRNSNDLEQVLILMPLMMAFTLMTLYMLWHSNYMKKRK